jgi:hypothetical protein
MEMNNVAAGFNKWINLLIAGVLCAIGGVVTVWATGNLVWGNIAITMALVFLSAQALYKSFWEPSGIADKIDAATTLVKAPE